LDPSSNRSEFRPSDRSKIHPWAPILQRGHFDLCPSLSCGLSPSRGLLSFSLPAGRCSRTMGCGQDRWRIDLAHDMTVDGANQLWIGVQTRFRLRPVRVTGGDPWFPVGVGRLAMQSGSQSISASRSPPRGRRFECASRRAARFTFRSLLAYASKVYRALLRQTWFAGSEGCRGNPYDNPRA
jgi:hypothetical protein